MPQQLNNSIDELSLTYLHKTRVNSQIIYSSTLLALIAAMLALPFIYTTVSVKGSGLMQSNLEKADILAPVSGKIIAYNLKDNVGVIKGKHLLSIDAALPKQQSGVLADRSTQVRNLLNDAKAVINAVTLSKENCILITGLYTSSWQQYLSQRKNAVNAKDQAYKIYKRYEILFSKKVVTQSEFEQYQFNYQQAVIDLEMVPKKYKTQWQTELNQYLNELKDIRNQEIQLSEQEKLYTVSAPVSGSLQNLSGLQIGAYVYANQKLAEISPNSDLLAFCYIKTSSIGLIKKGQVVRFQIDAFNYNQWGMLSGKVVDISNDIIMQEQAAYFKVKCKLDQNYLILKNGYRGYIKKGMTFNANFIVTKRSLFQLLYDKIDDWINPSIAQDKT